MAITTQINAGARQRGFTLIELALVLAIAAFLIFVVGGTASVRLDAERLRTTQYRMAAILRAIEHYAQTYRHLPCPASPTGDTDAAGFGDGSGTGGNSDDDPECTASGLQPTPATGTPNQVLRGAVPVIQLGLNPLVAVDGWGRKFSYVVAELYTTEENFMDFHSDHTFAGGMSGNIEIKDNTGAQVTPYAAVMVISHGANGSGAYTRSGTTLTASVHAPELENTNSSSDSDYYATFPSQLTDDIVDYRMRWQLIP